MATPHLELNPHARDGQAFLHVCRQFDDEAGRGVPGHSARQKLAEAFWDVKERDADFRQQDEQGMTALHYAAKHGFSEIASTLIELGADIHAGELEPASPQPGQKISTTPLHLAAGAGHLDIVKMLVSKENPNPLDKNRRTPIYDAIEAGHAEIMEYLIEHWAHIGHPNGGQIRDEDGNTPLHVAIRSGHIDLVQRLLDRHVSPNECNRRGETPLSLAAKAGNEELVWLLLAHSAEAKDIEAPGYPEIDAILKDVNSGQTPLQAATARLRQAERDRMLEQNTRSLQVMEEKKIRVTPQVLEHARANHAFLQQATPEELAASWQDAERDLNALGPARRSYLHIAADIGNRGIARLLIDSRAPGSSFKTDLDVRDGYNRERPLTHAIRNGDVEMARLLKQRGANINVHTRQGQQQSPASIPIGKRSTNPDPGLARQEDRALLIAMYEAVGLEAPAHIQNVDLHGQHMLFHPEDYVLRLPCLQNDKWAVKSAKARKPGQQPLFGEDGQERGASRE